MRKWLLKNQQNEQDIPPGLPIFLLKITTAIAQFCCTNSAVDIMYQDRQYHPTAFEIKKINFNDDGKDALELFWPNNKFSHWIGNAPTGAKLDVYISQASNCEPYYLSRFFYHSSIQEGAGLRIVFKSIATRLEKSLINNFSKTCRASLGDKQCCVNLPELGEKVEITSISRDCIITTCQKQSGYYNYGKLRFMEEDVSFLILRQDGGMLFLACNISQEFSNNKQAVLFPGCDKTINTCSNKFNNSINFRGEPFVPNFHHERMLR